MASLRNASRDVLDVARDGIGWIAVWKEGRSWYTADLWPEISSDGAVVFEDYETEKLRSILANDPNAILVNSYYHNLGDVGAMTRDSLADYLVWQYSLQHYLVADALSCGAYV